MEVSPVFWRWLVKSVLTGTRSWSGVFILASIVAFKRQLFISKYPEKMTLSHIDTLLAESAALDEIERVQRFRFKLEDNYISHLRKIRGDVRHDVTTISSCTLPRTMTDQIDDELRQRTLAQTSRTEQLDQIPRSEIWNRFLAYVKDVKSEELKHEAAAHDAEECLNANKFWERVRHTISWCDLRLPTEDIKYRVAVDRLNEAKSGAFKFYQKNQGELKQYHQRRLDSLACLVSSVEINSFASRESTLTEEQVGAVGLVSSSAVVPDSPLGENMMGPFTPTRYTNHLYHNHEGYPVFGLSLRSKGGGLANLIIRHNCHSDILTPPLPIFTPAIPETEGTVPFVEAAFRMETLWDGIQGFHEAWEHITDPEDENPRVDKGWLLGFLLVNLPQPLIGIAEPLTRTPHKGIRSEEISYVLPKDEELVFFKKLWRHTTISNIELGAAAITQRKDTEKIMSDIRSKWDIEVARPLPHHRRKPSEDKFWLTRNRRSMSGDQSSA